MTAVDDFNAMTTFPRSFSGWLALADDLKDGRWHKKVDLAARMATKTDLKPESAANLLRQAYRVGYIEGRMAKKRRYYRVTELGRRQRPELRVR